MSTLIYEQIVKVMSEVGAVKKDGYNEHQRYKFRSVDDVYNALHVPLWKNGVFFVPDVMERLESRIQNAGKNDQHHVRLKVKYKIFAKDGSSVEATTWGEAIDTSDKASNKAMTAALKYMLVQVFCIPFEDMDEADKHSPDLGKEPGPQKQAQMPPVQQKRAAPPQPGPKQPPARVIPNPIVEAKAKIEAVEKDPGEFQPNFGKFKGKKLKELNLEELAQYVAWMEGDSASKKKEITGHHLEFVTNAISYINRVESMDADPGFYEETFT